MHSRYETRHKKNRETDCHGSACGDESTETYQVDVLVLNILQADAAVSHIAWGKQSSKVLYGRFDLSSANEFRTEATTHSAHHVVKAIQRCDEPFPSLHQ